MAGKRGTGMSFTLFTLAVAVWQGAPLSLLYFVGATPLGVIYPLGTWAIAKRYPKTDWLAWLLLWITAASF